MIQAGGSYVLTTERLTAGGTIRKRQTASIPETPSSKTMASSEAARHDGRPKATTPAPASTPPTTKADRIGRQRTAPANPAARIGGTHRRTKRSCRLSDKTSVASVAWTGAATP